MHSAVKQNGNWNVVECVCKCWCVNTCKAVRRREREGESTVCVYLRPARCWAVFRVASLLGPYSRGSLSFSTLAPTHLINYLRTRIDYRSPSPAQQLLISWARSSLYSIKKQSFIAAVKSFNSFVARKKKEIWNNNNTIIMPPTKAARELNPKNNNHI